MSKEVPFKEVANHNTKKDLYMIIHDKVYNASSFIDEHPGGEEVLLDVAGSDATEAFEDVGHSDEAREVLDGLLVGALKREPGDPAPKTGTTSNVSAGPKPTGGEQAAGMTLYAIILLGGLLAYGAYVYLGQQDKK